MFQLIIFIAGLSAVLATPQWHQGHHAGYGASHGGYAAPHGGYAAPHSGYGASHGGYAAPHGGVAPLGPDGRVVDTPEVQQLKAAHLATLAEATARAPKGPAGYASHDGSYNDVWSEPNPSYAPAQYGPRYHGPPAPLGPDGRVVDTAEVQAAKSHHFSLFNAAAQHAPAAPAPAAYPAHADYDSGAYNPAWDGPAWNNQY